MKQILRPVYIFALNTDSDLEQHILHHNGLRSDQFKKLQGCYKGEIESSYIVDADFVDIVFKLAKEYNQESVLFLDETRTAYLMYIESGKTEKLGTFKALNSVKDLDAYTIDLSSGQAYGVA